MTPAPTDRRTFLAGGLKATGVVTAAGLVAVRPKAAGADRYERVEAGLQVQRSRSGLSAAGLTANGSVDPLGVDPDACFFAWRLTSSGRGVRQRGYRITVHRDDPGHAGVAWDSGQVTSGRQAFIPYGGPPLAGDARYRWVVEIQEPDGTWSAPSPAATFVTSLRPSDWTAKWLQPAGQSNQPNRVTYLRTVITPPRGVLARATAVVSAAHKYLLYVNGDQVGAGPSFSYPDEQYAQSVDLTATIRPGRPNALGVLHHWYGPGQGRPASAPGLIVQVSLHYADGRVVSSGTDGTWREHPAEWLPSVQRNPDGGDFVEWVDGRAHPEGWGTPGFDPSGWTPSIEWDAVGGSPFNRTYAQRTQIDDHIVAPVSLHTLANGSVVADFGAVYAARLRVQFNHGISGWTVPMHVGYLLDPDGQVSTLHGTQETNLSFSYITRRGAQQFEALSYLGFRYLQIDHPPETLRADQLQAIATHAAMPETPMATFSTGNRTLNAVWKLNARSCLYCTHEQFVDTPTREKGQFLWDAANESEAVMRTYGDQNMTWQALRDVARGQARYWPNGQVNAIYPNDDGARMFGTSTARYPEWLWRYYVATGDLTTAVQLYQSTRKAADALWAGRDPTTGLLTGFADGSNGDPVYGYDQSVTADTTSNVLGINAFARVAQLAGLAGDAGGAATQLAREAQLTAAVNSRLVRPDGVYTDGLEADGTQSAHASQTANALALAYRVVPAEHLAAVAAYVVSLGISLGPNHGLELLRGLAEAELWDDMVHTLTDATIPGWAHIVASGGTFTWETWVPSDLIGDSMSHGWGSSALVAMQESLLGVTLQPPDTEGTVLAAVAPPRRGLAGARGSVPSIAGPIGVTWSQGRRALALDLVVPTNAAARVSVPADNAASVREGGVPAARAAGVTVESVSGGTAVLLIGSGSYHFTVARP
jgi:alpha-L-rhamnosidase